jgi:hypothetical protein
VVVVKEHILLQLEQVAHQIQDMVEMAVAADLELLVPVEVLGVQVVQVL